MLSVSVISQETSELLSRQELSSLLSHLIPVMRTTTHFLTPFSSPKPGWGEAESSNTLIMQFNFWGNKTLS